VPPQLRGQGLLSALSSESQTRRHDRHSFGKASRNAKALFPGYMFVWMADEWRQLLRLIHVKGFVRRGGVIVEVPPRVVAELRAREGPTGYVRLDGRFLMGQQVRVAASGVAGVYAGLTADHKARVLFTMLGREVAMAFHEDELTVA
jgi:transcription antitermination factor NusG